MYGEVGVINMNNQMTNNNQINQTMNTGINSSQAGIKAKNQGKVMTKSAKNNPKYTENWLPLKAISNGIECD